VIAALKGLKKLTRGVTMLRLFNTTDMASGMPSPLISGEQYWISKPTSKPPAAGKKTPHQWCAARLGGKYAELIRP
jgi:hypothetical protein